MLYHFQLNGPLCPGAQPYDSCVFMAEAVVVVLLNRRRMFPRRDAPTSMFAPENPPMAEEVPAPRN